MAEESGRSQMPESPASVADRAKWVISAILMLVVTAGYWAVSRDHRTKLEEARATAERQRQTVKVAPKTATDVAALPSVPESPRPLADSPSAAPAATDGVYAGPICYGPAPGDRPRCFRAQAEVVRGKIAGQWPGRDTGVTMVLGGEDSATGAAKLRGPAVRPDGSRIAAIDLVGILKNGRLDAIGSFQNGRTAMLNWRRTAIGSR